MVAWSDVRSFYTENKTTIIVAGAVSGLVLLYKLCGKKPEQPDYPKDVVILHQFPSSNTPNSSPFCLKLETYLRIAKIPYQSVYGIKKSSKGKIPWIEYNGEVVSDSNFCVRYLNKKFNVDLDNHLNHIERAISRSFHVMLEENTFWALVYYRFVDNYDQFSARIFEGLPAPLRWFVSRKIQKLTITQLKGQGIGRHTSEEVQLIFQTDIQALSMFLANKKYFMGDKVSFVDSVAFAHIASMIWEDVGSPQCQYISTSDDCKNLVLYAERMKEEFYPDWNELISQSNQKINSDTSSHTSMIYTLANW